MLKAPSLPLTTIENNAWWIPQDSMELSSVIWTITWLIEFFSWNWKSAITWAVTLERFIFFKQQEYDSYNPMSATHFQGSPIWKLPTYFTNDGIAQYSFGIFVLVLFFLIYSSRFYKYWQTFVFWNLIWSFRINKIIHNKNWQWQ